MAEEVAAVRFECVRAALRGRVLAARLHVDLLRVCAALCPASPFAV
ncbi:hypothetical protein [Kitasatospora sp. NPDC004531]